MIAKFHLIIILFTCISLLIGCSKKAGKWERRKLVNNLDIRYFC